MPRPRRFCSIPHCPKPHLSRGLCSLHYQRWYKGSGDPNVLLHRPSGSGSLWHGYKFIHINGKQRPEHRVVMEQHLGRSLLCTEIVHHRDHNGLNNAIENLELMTRKQHMAHHKAEFEHLRLQSMVKVRGEKNWKAKLNEAQVRIIRSAPWKQCAILAKEFGTTLSNIKTIRSGYTWRHIT